MRAAAIFQKRQRGVKLCVAVIVAFTEDGANVPLVAKTVGVISAEQPAAVGVFLSEPNLIENIKVGQFVDAEARVEKCREIEIVDVNLGGQFPPKDILNGFVIDNIQRQS